MAVVEHLDLTEKKVVVTGGNGFLGRHVVRDLRNHGCGQVFALRRDDFDLRRASDIVNMLRAYDPHVVIHLAAAVGGVGANEKYPGRFFYDNAIMGVQLMEQARLHGVEKFVTIGTICSYPKFTPVPFKETDFWNGYPEETTAPYGLAKKMLLVQAQAYRRQYGFSSIHLLPVNLYGPGDHFSSDGSHVIPAIIHKCVTAREQGIPHVTLWGDGQATREFLYVEDAAGAIRMATEQYDGSQPVNIGTGLEMSIRSMAALIAQLTGYQGTICWDETRPAGQPRRALDIESARLQFGFQATTDIVDGLQKTIRWYEDARAQGKVT